MEQYKQEFIEFMIDCQVLKFGDFVTKSGRKTPFFVNTGFYRTGSQLRKLGEYYAQAIKNTFGLEFDVLFGPAYKGIPLSVAATIALSEKYDADIYVIQECEKPEKYPKEFSRFLTNYIWYGENDNKGLGIFAKPNIKMVNNNWPVYRSDCNR